MADAKISQLSSIAALSLTDTLPIVNQGSTKKVSVQQLQSFFTLNTSLTSVNGYTTALTTPLLANTNYLINASSASQTVVLPPNPNIGATISFLIYINPNIPTTVTIDRNGKLITAKYLTMNSNLVCDYSTNLTLVYMNPTQGWLIQNVFPH